MTRTRKWSLLTALAVVVILLIGWFGLVAPKRSSADSLRNQAAAQEQQNNTLKAQIADLQAKQKNLPQQQAIIADVHQRIPQNPDLPALIRSLSSMASATGVDLHTLSPVQPVASTAIGSADAIGPNGETLQVITASMEVDGTYFNIERFLNKVESLKRSLLVTGLSLNVNAGTPGTTGGSNVAATQAGVSPQLAAVVSFRAFMVSSATAPGTSPLHSAAPTTTTTGGTQSTTSSSTAQ